MLWWRDNKKEKAIRKAGYKVYLDPSIVSIYYARDTFAGIIKQMYANGESIGILHYIDKDAIGLRHLIPLFFIAGIIFGAVFSIVFTPLVYVYLFGLASYLICNILASLQCSLKHGMKFLFPLSALFFVVHVSYGIGIIVGLIRRKY